MHTWLAATEMATIVALALTSQLVFITLAAWTLERSRSWKPTGSPSYISLHHPVAGVFQNQLLFTFAGGMLIVLVNATYVIVQERSLGLLVAGLMSLFTAVVGVFVWPFSILEKDVTTHVEMERMRRPSRGLMVRAREVETVARELNQERVNRIDRVFKDRFKLGYAIPLFVVAKIASVLGRWRS